jgi:leucyl/phenylalanyl-tRNA--protein transferase
MLELFKLNQNHVFPAIDFALDEPNGLLAFGGDLAPQRLINAYKSGIFPWYSEQEPILWWSPDPRAIIDARTYQANKSLRKSIRKFGYYAKLNSAFSEVIRLCANVPRPSTQYDSQNQSTSTWISNDMVNAYQALHKMGYAHSVEIYNKDNQLVGGLYGVVVSGIFCGESMFHLSTDASKAAFLALSTHMRKHNLWVIDCQLVNPHLERLGCQAISRQDFSKLLVEHAQPVNCWQAQDLRLES